MHPIGGMALVDILNLSCLYSCMDIYSRVSIPQRLSYSSVYLSINI